MIQRTSHAITFGVGFVLGNVLFSNNFLIQNTRIPALILVHKHADTPTYTLTTFSSSNTSNIFYALMFSFRSGFCSLFLIWREWDVEQHNGNQYIPIHLMKFGNKQGQICTSIILYIYLCVLYLNILRII